MKSLPKNEWQVFSGTASLSFVDNQHGWVMLRPVSSSNFSVGSLLASSDGGLTWIELPDPPAGDPIAFVTPVDGWMVGGPSHTDLYVTRDGGRTWQAMAIHAGGDYDLPRFTDPLHGSVVVHSDAPGGATVHTYRTQDGGHSWQAAGFNVLDEGASAALIASEGYTRLRTVAKAAYLSSEESFLEVDFLNDQNGWLLAGSGACDSTGECHQRTRLVAVSEGESVTDITPADLRPGETARFVSLPKLAREPHTGGFDKCSAPAVGQMQTWWTSSPYDSVNVYLGGVSAACSPPSAAWVSQVAGMGWGLIPTWAGPQAPCSGFSQKMSSSTSEAEFRGGSEANAASDAAAAYGLVDTAVFYDLGNYNAADTSCSAAVQAFITGWVRQMHARGNLAGVYGSPSVISDLANASSPPDAIRGYARDHSETYGGVALTIHRDVANGTIAGGSRGRRTPPTGVPGNSERMILGPAGRLRADTGSGAASSPAATGFKINVTYGGTVPAAAQTAFNSLVSTYQSLFSNNVTVNINVNFGSTGLGASNTQLVFVSYTNWRAAVIANSTANPGNTYAAAAAASLPVNDPIGDGTILVRTANARALGLPGNVASDSTLTFNSTAAFEYNGIAAPGKFDFMDVAAHELDEALGIGSSLTGVANNGAITGFEGEAEDFFRYSATNTRAITTNPAATVYFSYDGGATNVAQFNQDNNNGDRNDWIYGNFGCPAVPVHYQDAISCSNQAVAVGPGPETIVLNTLGYNTGPPPPPPSKEAIFRNGLWVIDQNHNFQWDNAPPDSVIGLGQQGDVPVAGDWNGDGHAKAGIFRNGQWVLDYNGNGAWDGLGVDRAFNLGQAGDIAVVGDWNGDGRAKVGIFRNGLWVLDYNGNGVWDGLNVDRAFNLGQAGDIPVVGDWNGDGRTKVGIFRNGLWVLDYNGNGVWDGLAIDRAFNLGQAGDTPLVGDWNGDGRAKVAIFRNGLWTFDYNGNGQWDGPQVDRSMSLGQAGDIPVVGDWNGSGTAKGAIFRNGLWVFDFNGNFVYDGTVTDRTSSLGTTGDKPVPARW